MLPDLHTNFSRGRSGFPLGPHLHDPDNHNGVITDLEPDMLECEVKWALGSTMSEASGDDGIPVELFQILKNDAVKVVHSICQQIWITQHGHRTGKGQFSFQSQRMAMPKNVQDQIGSDQSLSRVRLFATP